MLTTVLVVLIGVLVVVDVNTVAGVVVTVSLVEVIVLLALSLLRTSADLLFDCSTELKSEEVL